VTGLVSVHLCGDNETELVMVPFSGDNETGVVSVQLGGDNETESDTEIEPVDMAPEVYNDTFKSTKKPAANDSTEQPANDTLSSVEQAAAESSGSLNSLHGALVSSIVAVIGIHSLL
jgi:hypothetical protein